MATSEIVLLPSKKFMFYPKNIKPTANYKVIV